jgi:hypothetical protein
LRACLRSCHREQRWLRSWDSSPHCADKRDVHLMGAFSLSGEGRRRRLGRRTAA